MPDKIERLKALTERLTLYEVERRNNLKRLRDLFEVLDLKEKAGEFSSIFEFKAINLSGILLIKERMGEVTPGKYAQIIGIKYVYDDGKKKAKNINLRYFGRAENLNETVKKNIIEFILRWRLEKSFMGVDHYRDLVDLVG